ncbi:hypothetical protein KBY27_04080 [Ruegeria pomeroyi]|uniref:Uncharacterized protein n=1 Tax=Ruegeria pomeroyi TaxID=89184 RepID=A0A9Q3ZL52_9RHOB|nr:hypothetical protein [Ruegeria pomeroyi]MCE8536625.1 hypothetical protein [Ruegeria pomeroyi]
MQYSLYSIYFPDSQYEIGPFLHRFTRSDSAVARVRAQLGTGTVCFFAQLVLFGFFAGNSAIPTRYKGAKIFPLGKKDV